VHRSRLLDRNHVASAHLDVRFTLRSSYGRMP
jgi:hypothetical protein